MTATATSAQSVPQILPAVRMGHFGNCVIHVWSKQFGAEEIETLTSYTTRAAEAWPNGIVMLALVEAGAPLPSSEGKRALEAYFAHFADRLRAVAYVAEGTGLWASMARSVMTALQLVRKRSYPTKVLSESSEGIDWLAPHLAAHPSGADARAELTRYVASLRALP